MRLTTSVIAGFIAVGAATPASLAVKPTSTKGTVHAVTAQPTPADGNWHISCNENYLCSYVQKDIASATSAADVLVALSDTSCQLCAVSSPCDRCKFEFECDECEHYQCYNEFTTNVQCFNVPPALGELVRNTTVTVTTVGTVTSTTVETSFTIATMSSVEVSTLTVTSTSVDEFATTTIMPIPTPEFTTTITLARTAIPSRYSGLAPRDQAASNDADTQPPVRRNVAFRQSQCVPCNELTCPECHDDCNECEKFMCNDIAAHLTVCMSVRSRWQPPSFNISASAPSETTTVVVIPQAGTKTTTQTVVVSTIVQTIPTSSASMVTILPMLPTSSPVVTVTVSAPAIGTTAVVVVPQVSTAIVSVPQVPTSTVAVVAQPPRLQTTTVTIVSQSPRPQVSTVTVVTQPLPLSTTTLLQQSPIETVTIQRDTVTVQNPASTIVYHQPASTIVLQPPTVTASPSPHVIEVPMTLITTATHTVVRSARAAQTPASKLSRDIVAARSICEPCDGNLECDGCDFSCDEDCEHLLCKDPLSEAEVCISVEEDAEASKAYEASMASGNFLGSTAMLLVLDDDEDLSSNGSAVHLQPAISNGTRPNFSFAEEDCYLCELGDESCDMCDWQFTCGTKKRCFHNGAREVVEMCFEKGEKCRP